MKMNLLKVGFFAITFSMTLALAPCNQQKQETDSKEYTSDFVCPMHCDGSGSDAEGQCPVCKMDYVANESDKVR